MYVCICTYKRLCDPPASMCSYCRRSFRILMADSLEKNICRMKSAVLRSMETVGLAGSVLWISDTSISSPTCTTFSGDLDLHTIHTPYKKERECK